MKKSDFDFYIGNKMTANLPRIYAEIFEMYAVCKTLNWHELDKLVLTLETVKNALDTVHEERHNFLMTMPN